MRVGRNESCPCGSGRKFKSCCEGKQAAKQSRGMIILVAAILIIAAVGILPMFLGDEKKETPLPAAPANAGANANPSRPGAPQPPGPVPPGKVWDVAHGHWHDATPPASPIQVSPIQTSRGNLTPTVTPQAPAAPVPQPAGEAPPGKVWSPEHGHWHDVATGQQ